MSRIDVQDGVVVLVRTEPEEVLEAFVDADDKRVCARMAVRLCCRR